MAVEFLSENFLLQSETARRLYHEHARKMPIYDYHCHLPAEQIADDVNFDNLTQIWLYGDHYKWRAMRTNGVAERYCTGGASDWEKFEKWAQTVPQTLRNPLYHWTHLELKAHFGITDLLNPDSAEKIYRKTADMLKSPEFSARSIMRKMNVAVVCTTEDPLDDLQYHKKIAAEDFEIKVHTAYRPDKALGAEDPETLNQWLDKLEQAADTQVKDLDTFIEALWARHDYFHRNGCRLSDYGIEKPFAADYTDREIARIFDKIRSGTRPEPEELLKYKSAMMEKMALMDADTGWVMQLHIGAQRNNNTRMFQKLGPDTGFDSIADPPIADSLARFLDRLDAKNKLPKTILYNLNPRDNELMATMIGNFQDGSVPGKIQYGSAWWFLDQKQGIEAQINALSNLGLLSRFVGMLTDSRSFLSYPRHEYFRRILCNILGDDVEKGLIPADMSLLAETVENICFNNAKNYFDMELD
ncbi:MAG: glucuronate isomerase [Planctomycetes bacterium]|nr:glucuronate isomerase [Planctomycetota bacterium]